MRQYSRALNTELFKYRKRKSISLDGTIAGQTAGIHIGGLHHVRPPGSRSRGFSTTQPQSIYDAKAFYEWPDQKYEQSASWFEQSFPGTPPLRVQGPPRHPRPPISEYDDCLMAPELQDHVASAFRQAAAEQALFPHEPQGSMAEILRATNAEIAAVAQDVDSLPSLADIADAISQLKEVLPPDHPDLVNLRAAAHEWLEHPESWPGPEAFGGDLGPSKLGIGDPYECGPYEEAGQAFDPDDASQMNQKMFDQAMAQVAGLQMMPEPMAEALDLMQDAYEQQFEQGLEAIVHEAMPEQDPYEMQQRMYDEKMQMLMNPFMMPGPFGPGFMGPGFGPMPGP